jgi:hypothetical protein
MEPDKVHLLQGKVETSGTSKFDFTEWWKVREGEILREPFDVRDEVVGAFMHALEKVWAFIFSGLVLKQVL